MRRALAFLFLALPAIGWANPPEFKSFVPEGPQPWTHLKILDRGEKFQFAIVTDRTGGMRPGIFEAAAEKLNLLQPAFVMSVGDLIEGGRISREELIQQWEEFDAIVDTLNMPFFYVPGNHDVSNSEDGRSLWEERVGPLFYHFLYKDVLFISMNSDDDTLARLGDAQIEYVKKALAENANVRWTFIFYHKPIFAAENSRWDEIEAVLKDRPHTVFSGHRHNYMNYERHTRDYFVLGTTGGGMTHQGLQMGHLDHIVWVTVDEGEPHIANLLLDGILDKNLRPEWVAELSLPLLQGRATPDTHVWASHGPWESLEATLNYQNPLPVPLKVISRIRPSEHFSPTPQRIEVALGPAENSTPATQSTTIQLAGLEKVRPEHVQSLMVEHAFIVEPEGKDPLLFTTHSRILFDTSFSVPRLRAEPVIDGQLNELDTLPLRCLEPVRALPNSPEWQGPNDASFAFAVARTPDHLYLCARVLDDEMQTSETRRQFRQDGLEIRLDARPEDQARPVETAQDKDQSQYLYLALNPHGVNNGVFAPETLPEGVEFICTPSEGGFVVEGLIPISLLEAKQDGDWTTFRLNLTLYDYDALSDSGSVLSWRPDWNRQPAPPTTSGRFHKTARD